MTKSASPTAEPAGFKTKCYIDSHAFQTGMSTAVGLRQKRLLEWLSSPEADSTDIIRWMQGVDFELHRQEDPALVLVCALPSADNFCEPTIREVLSKRISEAVIWLATDDSENCLWNHLAEDTWIQLFMLIRRLGVSSFKTAVMQLFQRCELEGGTPFKHDSETAKTLTRFVMVAQPNNDLENRWVGLIKGDKDPVLKASLFESFRGLLSMPFKVDDFVVTECANAFNTRINNAFKDETQRSSKLREFLELVDANFKSYSALIHDTLELEPILISAEFLLYGNEQFWEDPAALAQIATQNISSKEADSLQFRARELYIQRSPQILSGDILQFVTEPSRQGLTPGDHTRPPQASHGRRKTRKRRKKVKLQSLKSYKDQLRATAKA